MVTVSPRRVMLGVLHDDVPCYSSIVMAAASTVLCATMAHRRARIKWGQPLHRFTVFFVTSTIIYCAVAITYPWAFLFCAPNTAFGMRLCACASWLTSNSIVFWTAYLRVRLVASGPTAPYARTYFSLILLSGLVSITCFELLDGMFFTDSGFRNVTKIVFIASGSLCILWIATFQYVIAFIKTL